MTPPNWDHVDHEITREVLEQKSIDEDSICQALTFAEQCLQADQHNEDVTHEMYHARASAAEEASECWNELGDTEATIEALRRFWSI
jgi:hypothetical protein